MKIFIEYNSFLLRKYTNKQKEQIQVSKDCDLDRIIELLRQKYGEEFINKIIDRNTKKILISIFINGINIQNINYNLKENSKINFLSLTTGG